MYVSNDILSIIYSYITTDELSIYGNVEGLNIQKKYNILKYTIWAMNWTSQYGHVDVLEWWKNSGLELKYNDFAMDLASEDGHINVLDWWKNSGLELKYTDDAMLYASYCGHINVLEWWKNSGLKN